MKTTVPNLQNRVALALGACGLALLAGCGGGDPGTPTASNPTVERVTAVTASVCGVEPKITTGTSGYEVSSSQKVLMNGTEALISTVVSLGGNTDASTPVNLSLTMQDMRETAYQGYKPVDTSDNMGVEMGSAFAPGSVGCVSGVARVVNVGTESTPDYLLSWASEALPSVPVGNLPDHVINGFEFIGNFTASNAKAVFHVNNAMIHASEEVQICHVTSSTAWTCSAPEVVAGDTQWTFTLPITHSGVYLLTSPRYELALE